jgi:hypothetical protein
VINPCGVNGITVTTHIVFNNGNTGCTIPSPVKIKQPTAQNHAATSKKGDAPALQPVANSFLKSAFLANANIDRNRPYVDLGKINAGTLKAIVSGFKSVKKSRKHSRLRFFRRSGRSGWHNAVKQIAKRLLRLQRNKSLRKASGSEKKPVISSSWDTKL